MTAFYLEIMPLQEPYDLGVDDNKRARVVFNIRCMKEPSVPFLEEIKQVLVDAAVTTAGNIYTSTMSRPPSTGTVVSIVDTSGSAPDLVHNQKAAAYLRPTAQIMVRSETLVAARTMAYAAYNALLQVRNATVTTS